jgi:hypothetical protein
MSARRSYPPNSPNFMLLEAAVFGCFKVVFAHLSKSNSRSHNVATKIVEELGAKPQQWVEHLDETFPERLIRKFQCYLCKFSQVKKSHLLQSLLVYEFSFESPKTAIEHAKLF